MWRKFTAPLLAILLLLVVAGCDRDTLAESSPFSSDTDRAVTGGYACHQRMAGGFGMCEDYAAALTLLLRGMDLEAQYVPGLTYSAEGNLVDHAWTVVKIDRIWYHLDSQLEDNISRHGWVRYRYFLRGDATLSASHRWGKNLIDARLLTEEQNLEIEENWIPPACPSDYPTPERYDFEADPAPDPETIAQEASAEIAAWETENGPLPPMELNIIPPVFGLDGYGPPDEG